MSPPVEHLSVIDSQLYEIALRYPHDDHGQLPMPIQQILSLLPGLQHKNLKVIR